MEMNNDREGHEIGEKQESRSPTFAPFVPFRALLWLGLFLLAFIPRALALDHFLTPDEFLWVDRTLHFFRALLGGDLAGTLRTGHPGVTTMWTGSLGLLYRYLVRGSQAPGELPAFLQTVPIDPLNMADLAAMRVPTAVITSLLVVALYFLVARLFDRPVALVGALILALDPFYIAYSRILHHDALETTFMTLAVLTILIYLRRGGVPWLLGSAAAAGLAALTKSPALFLGPFMALLVGLDFLVRCQRRERLRAALWQSAVTYLVWGLGAAAAFIICWPAMWVTPLRAVQTILDLGGHYAEGPHAKGAFFLGQPVPDPGPLFYPVSWIFTTTPLVLVGLVALIAWGSIYAWQSRGREATAGGRNPGTTGFLVLSLLLYTLLFVAFMTLGGKKQSRYILPVFPIMDTLAALGLVYAGRWLSAHALPGRGSPALWKSLGTVGVVLAQLAMTAPTYPYYLTYYNPLLGGLPAAANTITVGWGEGLDEAGRYLSTKPNVARLKVTSWYASTFAPFFPGQTISYAKEKEKALSGDYVIFYINQVQRQYPDEEMFRFFQERYPLDRVIRLDGVDYAWIYPAPGMQHRVDSALTTYRGIAALLGWDWLEVKDPAHPIVPAGGRLPYRLYWEYLGKAEGELIFMRLLDDAGQVWGEGISKPTPANGPISSWAEGKIVEEMGELAVKPDAPSGPYRLQIGFNTAAVPEGVLYFPLPAGDDVVTVVDDSLSF
jgi:4-amino-4-deoxy-L-arabinose transferase-like glycosyltransferase